VDTEQVHAVATIAIDMREGCLYRRRDRRGVGQLREGGQRDRLLGEPLDRVPIGGGVDQRLLEAQRGGGFDFDA